jgi:hypothetical protein
MAGCWQPTLSVTELRGGCCRLSLGGVASGDGETLQEAADSLVVRLLTISMTLRECCSVTGRFGQPDPHQLTFFAELAEIAAGGGDIRERIFGCAGAVSD